MDKVTKRIFIVLAILIIGSIAMTYDRTIVRKDYVAIPPEPEEEAAPAEESAALELSFDVDAIPSGESTSTP